MPTPRTKVRSHRRPAADTVSPHAFPHRRVFIAGEVAIGGAATLGSAMLLAGVGTPEVARLAALHLHSWVLPGVWLFGSVAVPSAMAARAALRRSRGAPVAVVVASALLLLELAVQVPFIGPSALQLVTGVPGTLLAGLALRARAQGWR